MGVLSMKKGIVLIVISIVLLAGTFYISAEGGFYYSNIKYNDLLKQFSIENESYSHHSVDQVLNTDSMAVFYMRPDQEHPGYIAEYTYNQLTGKYRYIKSFALESLPYEGILQSRKGVFVYDVYYENNHPIIKINNFSSYNRSVYNFNYFVSTVLMTVGIISLFIEKRRRKSN